MAQLAVPPPMTGPAGARRTRLSWPRRSPACTTDAGAAPVTELTDQRAMLAHVRVLEAALEEQVREVARLTSALEAERARPLEQVRRISATVEGLRVAFRKDPVAHRLLARIDAALDRLVEPGAFTRVPLPDDRPSATTPAAPRPSTRAAAVSSAPKGDHGLVAATETAARVEPIPAAPEPADGPRRRGRLRK